MRVPGIVDEILLRRSGLLFLEPTSTHRDPALARAAALELTQVGVVPSTRLEQALAALTATDLTTVTRFVVDATLKARGGDVGHTPLFRRFPDGVPTDTTGLWWQKVLSHFLQREDTPCLFCGASSTTHVLSPCTHVVCDACFDGSSYSACPVCEQRVDTGSPFFTEAPSRPPMTDTVKLRRLDLGDDVAAATRALFLTLCARPQALSPGDRDDLTALVRTGGAHVLSWLPPTIPVKENVALVFGTLFGLLPADAVLTAAKPHLKTATDVLRLIAVMSGADASLQGETRHQFVDIAEPAAQARFWGAVSRMLGLTSPPTKSHRVSVATVVKRFKMTKLPRPLRRALLGLLEAMPEDRLVEDMLRHRSYWVWVGEFLHPHEYATRFPQVATAFQAVRQKAPDGTKAPKPSTFSRRAEAAVVARDLPGLVALLETRPGEFARRFDHCLRLCVDDQERRLVLEGLLRHVDGLPTPLLLTLRSALATRTAPLPVRLFFPKGQVGKSVSAKDVRPTLSADVIRPAVAAFDEALLSRLARKPALPRAVVDARLADIVVPFNERTASRAAVSLPRGSHVALDEGKVLRLFLHWCQPEGGDTTDIDLSVGFYDDNWAPVGVCSFYQLTHSVDGATVATSSGDLRDGPFPDGASEFVDVNLDAARKAGHRYAVMVVNNFAGMPFSRLERAFAGLMWRGDPKAGEVFDPRTVALRFNVTGDNGVFLPLVVDLEARRLHWLDVYAKGEFLFNSVKTSNRAIQRIGPEMLASFGSGVRPSMHDLALLHAAARSQRVELRGRDGAAVVCTRRAGESAAAFLARLRARAGDDAGDPIADDAPALLALLHGDERGSIGAPPAGSVVWALFPETLTGTVAASDLLA